MNLSTELMPYRKIFIKLFKAARIVGYSSAPEHFPSVILFSEA